MPRLLLLISLPLYILDQVTKLYVVKHFELNGGDQTVIENFFWIHHTANTGVAFGMGNGEWWANYVFGGISLFAAILIAVLWRKGAFPGPYSRLAAVLLYAGIAGNFTDRMLHGYVVDFLKFDLKFMVWPSFNVADSCVVCAAILLFVSSFIEKPVAAKTPAAP
jgi:signal peptidase II